MKIVTLTLNPAFDLHCRTESFRLGHESFFEILSRDAGGKGVNLSRALDANGVPNRAIVCVGRDNAQPFLDALASDGMTVEAIAVPGAIRENIVLHDASPVETRVSFNGFSATPELLDRVREAIGDVDEDTCVTLTGSLPGGITADDVKPFLADLKKNGAKIVLDSRSFTLDDLCEVSPFLIKPNGDEFSAYFGQEIASPETALAYAKTLCGRWIPNVLVSLGAQGAVLASDKGDYLAAVSPINARSTIGAGDSTVAGFLSACAKHADPAECLRIAVSFGTAACLRAGTLPPLPADVKAIYETVTVCKK